MYSLRLADPADLPAIVDIYNATVALGEITLDMEPVSVQSRFSWFRDHQRPQRPLWVVEPLITSHDTANKHAGYSSVLGWMCLSDFYGQSTFENTAQVSIYCDPAMRNKGLGHFLLNAAMTHAPSIGVSTLLGYMFAHNYSSLRLAEKCGFERWGRLPAIATIDQTARDLLILGKHLR